MTSIQKFLGHKKLNMTMVYARAYDASVEADYFAAMSRIELRLELTPELEPGSHEPGRKQLLVLIDQLTEPELSFEARLEISAQMRSLLNGGATIAVNWIPPPVSVLADLEAA